jgi:hypothetical protein
MGFVSKINVEVMTLYFEFIERLRSLLKLCLFYKPSNMERQERNRLSQHPGQCVMPQPSMGAGIRVCDASGNHRLYLGLGGGR